MKFSKAANTAKTIIFPGYIENKKNKTKRIQYLLRKPLIVKYQNQYFHEQISFQGKPHQLSNRLFTKSYCQEN